MNLSINQISFMSNPKVLSKAVTLKDGMTVNLDIVSKAPKTYKLNCFSYSGEQFKSAYGEIVNNADRFEKLSQNFIDKISKTAADEGFIKEIKEFFEIISK